ncbi:caspase domain-containing protein [Sphingorhabdus sp.]|uniref:caspase family protein n=1 Tax=Sphingorhabdus sp. TaxID=1902408 RepID=UPI0035AEA833
MKFLGFLLLLVAALPVPAHAQQIRTLFVGIDSYQFSSAPGRKAAFKDLKGAVNDSLRFKKALAQLHGLELDPLSEDVVSPENCKGETTNSITLVNFCAKRDAILGALETLIARSAPQDTVLFYFAGHGSQYPSDSLFDQASGFNGTILPSDAREPGSIAKGDILDIELKAIKDKAAAAGIRFVTIFDSCNSGTATRDGASGESRNVPMLTVRPPVRGGVPTPVGPGGGYWVHLAAAQDGEQAQEIPAGSVGKREGVFTTALIEAMFAMPGATFGDLIREVRTRVALGGLTTQTPVGEGQLTASLGSAARPKALFEAKLVEGEMQLQAGRLTGIVEGSRFSLFPNQAQAVAINAKPLATATVTDVEDYVAKLALDVPHPNLGTDLIAVETMRGVGKLKLRIANIVKKETERAKVQLALDALPFFGGGKSPVQAQIGSHPEKKGEAVLFAVDGTHIGELGPVDAPEFAEKLSSKLRKILRVQQLLDLRTENGAAQSAIRFCVDDQEYAAPSDGCPPMEKRQMRLLKRDAQAIVTVNNESDKPLYFYVFGIDPTFGVALVLPRPGDVDPAVAPLQPYRNVHDPVVPLAKGTYRFVTIATERPINAAALEQDGTNSRSVVGCASPLERLLCDAQKGVRGASVPRAGDWKAIVETVIVE